MCVLFRSLLLLGIIEVVVGLIFSNSIVIDNKEYTFLYDDTIDMKHIAEAIYQLAFLDLTGIIMERCVDDDFNCTHRIFAEVLLSTRKTVDEGLLDHVERIPSSGVFSGIDDVILNLGSNIDPVVPQLFVPFHDTDPDILVWRSDTIRTIAFEPVLSVVQAIEEKPWLHVVPAAVSSRAGIQEFNMYNINALSSSLLESNVDFSVGAENAKMISPVVSLQSIIDMIPTAVDIAYLKTDMQGTDFQSVSSIGRDLLRVKWIATEVWHHNRQSYKDARNDFCRDWMPYMSDLGYSVRAVGIDCDDVVRDGIADLYSHCEQDKIDFPTPSPGLMECDILWARSDVPWNDIRYLPPVSGRELIDYKWVGQGALFNTSINRF